MMMMGYYRKRRPLRGLRDKNTVLSNRRIKKFWCWICGEKMKTNQRIYHHHHHHINRKKIINYQYGSIKINLFWMNFQDFENWEREKSSKQTESVDITFIYKLKITVRVSHASQVLLIRLLEFNFFVFSPDLQHVRVDNTQILFIFCNGDQLS